MSSRFPELPAAFLQRPLTHRGMHNETAGILENSRQSFRDAIDHGFGIELDLQLSKDGEAMVFHDYNLKRLTPETGLVRQRTAEELRQVPLTSGDETIPDFAEILDLIGGRVPLLVELKDQDGIFGPDVGPLEKRTAELLDDYNGEVAVMSFNPYAVIAMRKYAPDIARGLTTDAFKITGWPTTPRARARQLRKIPDYDRAGARFISHNRKYLDTAPVARIKERGDPVLTWTVRSPKQEAAARRIADNITFEGYIPA